jgi:hypothetical protein
MPTYLNQSPTNHGDLIFGASQPTPTSARVDNSEQRPAPENLKWLLSTDEAAEFLGLSPSTLAKWRVTGMGPPFQALGRRCLYDPEALRRWAASRARRSTSENVIGGRHDR